MLEHPSVSNMSLVYMNVCYWSTILEINFAKNSRLVSINRHRIVQSDQGVITMSSPVVGL